MEFPLLSLLWMVPLIGMVLILLTKEQQVQRIKTLAGLTGFFSLALSILVYLAFDRSAVGFQLEEISRFFPVLGISYHLGIDGLSLPMVVLTGILTFSAILVSFNIKHRLREYFALTLACLAGVFGIFVSLDLFFFILFYELASIPMYFLIGIWGSDKEGEGRTVSRRSSALKLILYLQLGGGLLLLGFLALYFTSGLNTFDLPLLAGAEIALKYQMLLFPLLFIGFGIEAGLFPFHTWLPDGHSAAPTALSMILAGVLLKMGGYGILRVAIGLLPEGAVVWLKFFLLIAVVNVLYGAFCALRQTDIKYLIAYSSISHMGIVFLGAGVLNAVGIQGAVFQMFSHGVITALLFALAGYIYEKTHTRIITKMGGLGIKMPCLAVIFCLGGFATLGLPGFSGFIAELMVFLGAFKNYPVYAILAIFGLVLTAIYVLRAVQKIFLGALKLQYETVNDLVGVEKAAPFILTLTTALLGFFPAILTGVMAVSVNEFLLKFGGIIP